MATIAREIIRGDTWIELFDYYEYDENMPDGRGDPIDISGAVIRCQVRNGDTEEIVFDLSTVEGGITISDQVSNPGRAVLRVEAPETEGLDPEAYYVWDVETTYSDNTRESTGVMVLSVAPDVTRPVGG